MRFSATLLVASLFCLSVLANVARSQEATYFWAPEAGGLVDLTSDAETPLTWAGGHGLAWLTEGIASYEYATTIMPGLYADSEHGGGYTDWRVPTKAELQDAAAKRIYWELVDVALATGSKPPYSGHYWASDPPFRYKGHWNAYLVDLDTGYTRATWGYARVILVRGGDPPVFEEKGGPKPK